MDDFIELADAIEGEFPELQVDGMEADSSQHNFLIKKEDGSIVTDTDSPEFPEAFRVIEMLREAGYR